MIDFRRFMNAVGTFLIWAGVVMLLLSIACLLSIPLVNADPQRACSAQEQRLEYFDSHEVRGMKPGEYVECAPAKAATPRRTIMKASVHYEALLAVDAEGFPLFEGDAANRPFILDDKFGEGSFIGDFKVREDRTPSKIARFAKYEVTLTRKP